MKVGIDLVSINRFNDLSESFLSRVFTEKEIEYCKKYEKCAEHFAGFFAAKEAVMKALELGIKETNLKEIEVCHKENGKPFVVIKGRVLSVFNNNNLTINEISISHTNESATAVCFMQ